MLSSSHSDTKSNVSYSYQLLHLSYPLIKFRFFLFISLVYSICMRNSHTLSLKLMVLLPGHVFEIKVYGQPIFKSFPINSQQYLIFWVERFPLKTLWALMHMLNCWYLHLCSKNEQIPCNFHWYFLSWNIPQIWGHDLLWPKFPWFEQLNCH